MAHFIERACDAFYVCRRIFYWRLCFQGIVLDFREGCSADEQRNCGHVFSLDTHVYLWIFNASLPSLEMGSVTCPVCKGKGNFGSPVLGILNFIHPGDHSIDFCENCNGTGKVPDGTDQNNQNDELENTDRDELENTDNWLK